MVTSDQYMAEVFPEPPLIAYRRQKNIKEFLVRAKVPPRNKKTKRTVKGMKKCNKSCHACPFILEGKEIKGDKFDWKITIPANCKTKNIVYMIECNKENCKQRYIGESKKTIGERLSEHKVYVNNIFPTQATGIHFNQPGHNLANLKITIVEKLKKDNGAYRKEKKRFLINKCNTYYRGINRMP